jgi:plasmid segregation protein ParM
MQICAIDNGYRDTKVKIIDRTFKYSSKIQNTSEDQVDGIFLECDGMKYRIGIGQDDINIRKTDNNVHKICTLAALAQTMQEETQEFKVVVGLPILHYKNKAFREDFRDYIAKPGIQNVRLNSAKKNIVIKDVLVFAQGGAALYSDPGRIEEYKNSLVAVVDWGGLTINGFVAERMNPIPESIFTVNLGMIILYNRIKTALNEKRSMNIQDYEIPYLMNGSDKELQPIIDEVLEEHFAELKKEMLKKNWSIETLNKVGVGGGFLATGSIPQKYLPKLRIDSDPVYANVKGMYNVGRMVFK